MNGDIGTSTQTPQLRALLFTDLCDSLILVERIGDSAAAELFQQHDRLVLTLQPGKPPLIVATYLVREADQVSECVKRLELVCVPAADAEPARTES